MSDVQDVFDKIKDEKMTLAEFKYWVAEIKQDAYNEGIDDGAYCASTEY